MLPGPLALFQDTWKPITPVTCPFFLFSHQILRIIRTPLKTTLVTIQKDLQLCLKVLSFLLKCFQLLKTWKTCSVHLSSGKLSRILFGSLLQIAKFPADPKMAWAMSIVSSLGRFCRHLLLQRENPLRMFPESPMDHFRKVTVGNSFPKKPAIGCQNDLTNHKEAWWSS